MSQLVAAEWIKLSTVRSTVCTAVAMAATTVGTAVLVAATASVQPGEGVVGAALGNAAIGQICAGILGVLIVCGEYSSGTIRATFTADPRRLHVLAAKTLVTGTVVLLGALASAWVAVQAATLVLDDPGHPRGTPLPVFLGVAASYAAVAVLGIAAGTALRHTAGAVTAVTAALLLPTLLGPLFGSWQARIAGASPIAVLHDLAHHGDTASPPIGVLGPWLSLSLLCGFSLIALAGSGWLLRSRDIG
jgi:ABC-2 type transport system permease protein